MEISIDYASLLELLYMYANNTKDTENSRIYFHAFKTLEKNYSEHLIRFMYEMLKQIDIELENNETYWAHIYFKMFNEGLKEYNDETEWEEQEKEIDEEIEKSSECEVNKLD